MDTGQGNGNIPVAPPTSRQRHLFPPLLDPATQQQTIPHIEQTGVDARVPRRLLIQAMDRERVDVHAGLVAGHLAAVEGVVDGDDAAHAQQPQRRLV